MAGYLDTDTFIGDFIAGSERAYDAVYTRFYDEIFLFCYKMVDNSHEAQDITTETLIKLFNKSKDFPSLNNIKAFLYITARNSCFDTLRKMKVVAEGKERLSKDIDRDFDLENELLDAAYLRDIQEAIAKLSPRQRQTIELLYYNGLKYKDAAAVMGISQWTVSELRERALSALRKVLRHEYYPEMAPLAILILLLIS